MTGVNYQLTYLLNYLIIYLLTSLCWPYGYLWLWDMERQLVRWAWVNGELRLRGALDARPASASGCLVIPDDCWYRYRWHRYAPALVPAHQFVPSFQVSLSSPRCNLYCAFWPMSSTSPRRTLLHVPSSHICGDQLMALYITCEVLSFFGQQ